MTVRHFGSTSGYTELGAPAVAGNNSLKLPTGNGSAGQSMLTDGSGNLSFGSSIVSGTSQASTSGTSIDFTGIPSWAKRVTVMFSGVSTSAGANLLAQIGSGSVVNTGYAGGVSQAGASPGNSAITTGLYITYSNTAASIHSGTVVFTNLTGNTWVGVATTQRHDGYGQQGGAWIALGGTLDRVRITTATGTDTFDAGTINLLWE